MVNNNDQVELVIRLDGPGPEQRNLQAYDIGAILIAIQRMAGTISSFELGGQDFRTNRTPEHQLSEPQLMGLTHRVLPSLTSMVNKIEQRSGITHLKFGGRVTTSGVEWNIYNHRSK